MSAIILQFPAQSGKNIRLPYGTIDVAPVDKRGFVILDACGPSWLSIAFLQLLEKHEDGDVTPVPGGVKAYADARYSFRFVQHKQDGLVLIEACVPLDMANELCAMAVQKRQSAA